MQNTMSDYMTKKNAILIARRMIYEFVRSSFNLIKLVGNRLSVTPTGIVFYENDDVVKFRSGISCTKDSVCDTYGFFSIKSKYR